MSFIYFCYQNFNYKFQEMWGFFNRYENKELMMIDGKFFFIFSLITILQSCVGFSGVLQGYRKHEVICRILEIQFSRAW